MTSVEHVQDEEAKAPLPNEGESQMPSLADSHFKDASHTMFAQGTGSLALQTNDLSSD